MHCAVVHNTLSNKQKKTHFAPGRAQGFGGERAVAGHTRVRVVPRGPTGTTSHSSPLADALCPGGTLCSDACFAFSARPRQERYHASGERPETGCVAEREGRRRHTCVQTRQTGRVHVVQRHRLFVREPHGGPRADERGGAAFYDVTTVFVVGVLGPAPRRLERGQNSCEGCAGMVAGGREVCCDMQPQLWALQNGSLGSLEAERPQGGGRARGAEPPAFSGAGFEADDLVGPC